MQLFATILGSVRRNSAFPIGRPDNFARQRAIAALAVLTADDLERVAVMVEALAARRM